MTATANCRPLFMKLPEIRDWLESRCKRPAEVKRDGIWFLDPDDAVIFKLTWGGTFT